MSKYSTSVGGMCTTSTQVSFCKVCNKNFFYGIELNNVWYFKHWTKAGNVLYCSTNGVKRSKHKPNELIDI